MTTTKSIAAAALSAVAAVSLTVAAPGVAAAEDEDLPVPWTIGAGVAAQAAGPDSPPPGSNDWSCEPGEDHPNPVVLVHGLIANRTVNWQTFSPLLANEGYCVFALTYGVTDLNSALPLYQPGGMTTMQDSAAELEAFVDRVLDATGANKVDLLGHSEGTIMPAWYVTELGGEAMVDKYVSLTPLWEGTNPAGLATLYRTTERLGLDSAVDGVVGTACASCTQFLAGSDYFAELNEGGMFSPDVKYTNIVTRYDELIVPYTSGMAEGPNITNHVLQETCPTDFAEHGAVMADPVAAGHVLNALDPDNPRPVPCTVVTPLGAEPPPEW